MSEWKEIFQFSRAETFALSILLLMVLIGGGILFYENSTETLPPELFFQSAGAATTRSATGTPARDTGLTLLHHAEPDSTAPPKKQRSVSAALMININTAPVESLMMLPRVGAVIGQRIVELRQKLGRFDTLEQLVQVRGIGKKTLALIRPYASVDKAKSNDNLKRDSVSAQK